MRRKDREIEDPQVISRILHSAHICRLAMLDGEEPYIVPLNFGYEEPCLYFHSAPTGRKIESLKRFPRVCFEVETGVEVQSGPEACDYTTLYTSIIGYGTVELLSDPADISRGLDVIMRQHGWKGPASYQSGYLNRMLVLRLRIESLSCKQHGKPTA